MTKSQALMSHSAKLSGAKNRIDDGDTQKMHWRQMH